ILQLLDALGQGRTLTEIPNLAYRDAAGQLVISPMQATVIDVDTLPMPRRDLTARHRDQYFFLFDQPDTSMVTGRGCPFRCNFCSVWEFYQGRTRSMTP